jgi:hypothetical protein
MLTMVFMKMVSSAKRFIQVPRVVDISLIYAMNISGDRHDLWGTPADGVLGSEKEVSTRTKYVLLERKDFTRLISDGKMCS